MAKIRTLQQLRREQVILAYQIGAFVGFSKLPPLQQVLQRLGKSEQPPERERMSEAEVMHTMALWAASLNGRARRQSH